MLLGRVGVEISFQGLYVLLIEEIAQLLEKILTKVVLDPQEVSDVVFELWSVQFVCSKGFSNCSAFCKVIVALILNILVSEERSLIEDVGFS